MRNRRIVALSIGAAALFCVWARAAAEGEAAPQSAMSSIQHEIVDLQKALVSAEQRGDSEYVKNAVADDFVRIESNGDASGKKEFVKDIHSEERPAAAPILYDFKVIELDEGCAIVTYKAVFAGNQLERYQHLSDTWVKQGGKWKLKFQQSTLNLWSAHDLD